MSCSYLSRLQNPKLKFWTNLEFKEDPVAFEFQKCPTELTDLVCLPVVPRGICCDLFLTYRKLHQILHLNRMKSLNFLKVKEFEDMLSNVYISMVVDSALVMLLQRELNNCYCIPK